ncbi:DUF305 domain-containing protein [Longimycelium tulufanense]|uniref:DUF305 domain-containing protein n=1 Tax=Longimycelium tulufanense TaxID=907463 RepID=UPI001E456008|nr:DUF305 domain-containing protein [Longimycelium tulufanense]
MLAGTGGTGAQAPNHVDIGFAQDMTVHHQQAVTTANWVRDHSTDRPLRELTFDIEHGQTEQIGRVQAWLRLWSQAALPTTGHMTWMKPQTPHAPSDPAHPSRSMPGMATTEELNRMRSLSGRDLDIYFLQLMIRHHQGGEPMMRAAQDRAAIGEVRNLAGQMLTAQTAEVEAMTAMLTERGAEPLPPPH